MPHRRTPEDEQSMVPLFGSWRGLGPGLTTHSSPLGQIAPVTNLSLGQIAPVTNLSLGQIAPGNTSVTGAIRSTAKGGSENLKRLAEP